MDPGSVIVGAVGSAGAFVALFDKFRSLRLGHWRWRRVVAEIQQAGVPGIDGRLLRKWAKSFDAAKALAGASTDAVLVDRAAESLVEFVVEERGTAGADAAGHARIAVEVLLGQVLNFGDIDAHILSSVDAIAARVLEAPATLDQAAEVVAGSDLRAWMSKPRWKYLLASHVSDNEVPVFVPRDAGAELCERLEDAIKASDPESGGSLWDQAVFVSGESKCGKTRLLLETLAQLGENQDLRVYAPVSTTDLSSLFERIRRFGLEPASDAIKVVLIDDLQFFDDKSEPLAESEFLAPLGDQLPRLVEACFTPNPERIIVAGTVWPKYVTGSVQQLRQSAGNKSVTAVDEFRRRLVTVDVNLSDGEFGDAVDLLGSAVANQARLRSLAPTLSALPEMLAQVDAAYSDADQRCRRAMLEALLVAFLATDTGMTENELVATCKAMSPALPEVELRDAFTWALTPPVAGPYRFATGHDTWKLTDPLVDGVFERVDHDVVVNHVELTPTQALRAGLTTVVINGQIALNTLKYTSLAAEFGRAGQILMHGMALGQLGRHDEEIAVYDEIIERFGNSPEPAVAEQVAVAMLNKGVRLGEQGSDHDAIVVYDEIIERFDDRREPALAGQVGKAMGNKAIRLGAMGLSDDALRIYDEIIERFGNSPEPAIAEQVAVAMNNKGIQLGFLRRNDEEIAVYDEIIERFGDCPEPAIVVQVAKAMVNKGVELGAMGLSDDAFAVYDEIIERLGDRPEPALAEQVAVAMFNKAIGFGAIGRSDKEIAVYDEIIERFGDRSEPALIERVARSMDNQVIELAKLGRNDEVIAVYDEIIERFGDRSEPAFAERVAAAMLKKVTLLLALGRTHEATSTLSQAFARYGDTPPTPAIGAVFQSITEASSIVGDSRTD